MGLCTPLSRPGEAYVHEVVDIPSEIEIGSEDGALGSQIGVGDVNTQIAGGAVKDDPRIDDVSALEIHVYGVQVTHLKLTQTNPNEYQFLHEERNTGQEEKEGKKEIDLRRDQTIDIQSHMVSINVLELDVHQGIELHGYEAGGSLPLALKAEETAGASHSLGVRRDEERKAGSDGGGVQVGNREGEEGGEARRRV
ncbi:hypothetical protein SAY87_027985 [Trapa incisa]|uniref:Uncharacterized protein n=1 Tax=Trapa incisa TaxID=236973 RepID=A0AAN7QP82_9MYRT|nr:hypothetical protein SAY87_027985 [Trapa incisa]